MIETPQITQSVAQKTAFIHLTIPRSEIQNVMGPGIQEVMATIAAQGIKPTGPWFTYHLKMDPATFDFQICVPVSAPIKASGRVQPGERAARQVARTVYQGPYEELGAGWGEFMEWIETNGHQPATDLWESYLVGPESSSNPADWRTELNRPLKN